jgi:hypothetical protein
VGGAECGWIIRMIKHPDPSISDLSKIEKVMIEMLLRLGSELLEFLLLIVVLLMLWVQYFHGLAF